MFTAIFILFVFVLNSSIVGATETTEIDKMDDFVYMSHGESEFDSIKIGTKSGDTGFSSNN